MSGLASGPAWISWFVLVAIVASLTLATLGLFWRLAIEISLLLLVWAILQDQNRFQPWAYQYLVLGLLLAVLPEPRSLGLARWSIRGLYLYSGLSKLDLAFCQGLGPTFLSAALGPLGIDPTRWSGLTSTVACLAMPGFEIAVAILLMFRATRRLGVAGAVVLHLALVLILGPSGLGHSTIVLVWNLALIVEDLFLFGPPIVVPVVKGPPTVVGRVVVAMFWLTLIVPLGERLGFCDAWPAHALYASHVDRAEVFVHEDDIDRFPESIRKWLGPINVTPWRRLDLTAWSREARGTPPYPSGRIGNAVAEFLELRYAGLHPTRLVHWSRASIFDAGRERVESLGLRSIHRRGDRFRVNAHPSALPGT